ncbi:MAG: cyclase family protein [Pseudomonadota bacterium]
MTGELSSLMQDRKIIDLAVEYFPGMPYIPATPPYQYGLTREHGDHVMPDGLSSAADQILIHTHSGTHIDAFCHYARGGRIFGGGCAQELQDKWKGFTVHAAHQIPPIVRRGVLLDVAACLGTERLAPGTQIDSDLLDKTQRMSGIEVRSGDVVLVRTGEIQLWPSQEYYSPARGGVPGLNLDGAKWISGHNVYLVGSDNYAIEHIPMPQHGRRAASMPVHGHLLVDNGIYLLEVMNLEELAHERIYEFVFITLPLKLKGATGSPVRPVALV